MHLMLIVDKGSYFLLKKTCQNDNFTHTSEVQVT
jgi:hypothetical protein